MTELFAPAAAWQRLPQRYVAARRLGALVPNAVVTIVAALLSGFFLNWWWAGGVAAAGVFWTAWRVARAGRWVRAFGYAERDADLLITRGLWHKELTAVPYGRMLSVNVESGPLDRAWGLARVELVTASMASNGAIPGLNQPDAAALRDRLIAAGEAQALPL